LEDFKAMILHGLLNEKLQSRECGMSDVYNNNHCNIELWMDNTENSTAYSTQQEVLQSIINP